MLCLCLLGRLVIILVFGTVLQLVWARETCYRQLCLQFNLFIVFDSKIKIIWLWLLSVWCIFWLPNVCWCHIIVSSYCVDYETYYVEDMWFIYPYVVNYDVKFNSNKLCGRLHDMPRPLQVDLWPFYLESGVRVTCDVGYLYANFSLPRPHCSRLRPNVRDRQTDRRQMCIIV